MPHPCGHFYACVGRSFVRQSGDLGSRPFTFGQLSILLATAAAVRAAPSYVDPQGVTPDPAALTETLHPTGLPNTAGILPPPPDRPGAVSFDSAWHADAEPAWATQADEWTGQNGPPVSLTRLGAAEVSSAGPVSPMAEPPAAVPLPGGIVGGGVTLAIVAALYVARRRQQLR
jgi:hypothetical protein